MQESPTNVYGFLAKIKRRPEMYIVGFPSDALATLRTLLWGYEAALMTNGIEEMVVGRPFSNSDFGDWLHKRFGWPMALGYAQALEDHCETSEDAFRRFFELLAEYRDSPPPT